MRNEILQVLQLVLPIRWDEFHFVIGPLYQERLVDEFICFEIMLMKIKI